jgi:hypothetical protein
VTTSSETALERTAPWIAGVLLALPVVASRYPPMTDLPLHEGMIAMLRHHGDPAWAPPNLYELNLGHTNQLLYLLATPLAFLVSTDTVCKAFVAGALVLALGGAGRLAAHLGTTRWSAVALAPVFVGWTFYWGFLPNMLGLAGLLWALPTLDRACETPSVRRAAGACVLALLLAFTHEASALAACVAVGVFSFVRPLDEKTVLRLAPAAAVTLASVIELVRERSVLTPYSRAFGHEVAFHTISTKLLCFTSFLVGAHGQAIEIALLGPAFAVIAYGVAARLGARTTASEGIPLRERLVRRRFELVALGLLVVYMLAPASVNFGAFLYERFLVPAFLIAALAFAPLRLSRVAKLVAAVAPLAALLVVAPELARASAEQRDLDALYPHIERASATFVFHAGNAGEPTLFSLTSAGNRVLAERGGRLEFSFTEYPISPLVVPPAYQWNDVLLRLHSDPMSLRPATDLDRFRYLLVHTNDDDLAAVVRRSLVPDAAFVAKSGGWSLFESTHPVVALTAPDAAEIEHPPETLRDRIFAVLRAQR